MASSSLFVTANHMLLLYCILYAIGDLLRAFWFESDQSDDAVGISAIFFVLSIWLVINSIIYYKAFLDEMDESHGRRSAAGARSTPHIEGTGVSSALAEAAANGAIGLHAGPISDADITLEDARTGVRRSSSGDDSLSYGSGSGWSRTYRRWTRYLFTEVGIAYFLNIVGSVGYVISSLISLFLTVNTIGTAREVDRASLYLDAVNMAVFIVDAGLFAHVWWRENEETTFRGKIKSIYFWANLCNTVNSVAYFIFISWSLRQRYRLAEEERLYHPDDTKGVWYEDQLIGVTFDQRSMYLCADLVYLIYAVLLELGWSWEHNSAVALAAQQRQSQQQQQQRQTLDAHQRAATIKDTLSPRTATEVHSPPAGLTAAVTSSGIASPSAVSHA